MFDFDRYFLKECQIFLSHIDYDVLTLGNGGGKINVTDNIQAYPKDDSHVKIEISRSLSFPNNELFAVTVIFGVLLTKNPLSKDEVDWSTIDVCEEFKRSKVPLINGIASRISMLLAQITSSFGQNPVVTPPQMMNLIKQKK